MYYGRTMTKNATHLVLPSVSLRFPCSSSSIVTGPRPQITQIGLLSFHVSMHTVTRLWQVGALSLHRSIHPSKFCADPSSGPHHLVQA